MYVFIGIIAVIYSAITAFLAFFYASMGHLHWDKFFIWWLYCFTFGKVDFREYIFKKYAQEGK